MKLLAKSGPGRTTAWIVLVTLALVGSLLLVIGLGSSAGSGTLADEDSPAAKATNSLHRQFGDEPITILVRARPNTCPGHRDCHLTDLVLTPDLLRVLSLEGCLSGNLPRRGKPPTPSCGRFAQTKPFASVEGPGTFINESARQISARIRADQRSTARKAERAAEAARRVAAAQGLSAAEQEQLARRAREVQYLNSLQPALRYGLSGRSPQVIDARFVHQLVFDASLGFDMPKTRFSRLFPDQDSAQILVRPREDLTAAERRDAISLLQDTVESPSFRLDSATYLVAGFPIASDAVASRIAGSVAGVGVAALVIAALALALVFHSRMRLLALVPILIAAILSFAVLSLTGGSLTIASIAVVPVLIAIAGGYGVFMHERFEKDLEDGSGHRSGGAGKARRFPLITVGLLVAVIALLALVLSPAPMVRSFGGLVACGVVLSVLAAAIVFPAVLSGRVRPQVLWQGGARVLARLMPVRLALARIGARTGTGSPARPVVALGRVGRIALGTAVRRPTLVVGVAALAAILGWVLQGEIGVTSRFERLAPRDVGAVKDMKDVQRETNTAGEVSVLVGARDVTAPGVIAWMSRYERTVLARHGYSEKRTCKSADLCPTSSLTSLLGGVPRNRQQARRVVRALPPSFTRGVLSADLRAAIMSFGIRAMPEGDQNDVVQDLRRQLHPPPDVSAGLAGRPALTESTDRDLESSGRAMALIALAAAFLIMLAIHRSTSWAALTLIPLALTTGWSSLVLLVVGIPVNPMSAALACLVVAIGTQLTLLASTRYRAARAAGSAPAVALERSFELRANTLASAAALMVAGFAALVVSDVRMLHDFGIDALATVFVALAGLALVLPATLVLREEGTAGFARQWTRLAEAFRLEGARARLGRVLRRRGEAQRP